MAEIAGLTEGRMVHFVLPNGAHRPAVVVQVWSRDTGCSNLEVFLDGLNDKSPGGMLLGPGLLWATSITFSEEPRPGTWHWIEKA